MVLQCLTWIPYLWDGIVESFMIRGRVVSPLPDDVVINILSRLPAECILRCRMVCKEWRTLTSTSYFAELHLKRVSPLLILQEDLDVFILDEDGEKDTMIKKMRMWSRHVLWKNKCFPVLICSCDGLLLFRPWLSPTYFYICNPVTQEEVSIRTVHPVYLCGFFFHSFTKEYRLLFLRREGDNCFRYMIYNLGSESCRQLSTFSYWPSTWDAPAIINGALHWMVGDKYKNEVDIPACSNSIMIFNMDNEDFHVMPHPGKECSSRLRHEKMHLLEMRGNLSLCHIYANLIEVWILEDYANWLWVRRYTVNLDWDVRRDPFDSKFRVNHVNYYVKVLNLRDDELLVNWLSRGIFRYHLRLHTVRKIVGKGVKIPECMYYGGKSIAYTKSLVSLCGFPNAVISS